MKTKREVTLSKKCESKPRAPVGGEEGEKMTTMMRVSMQGTLVEREKKVKKLRRRKRRKGGISKGNRKRKSKEKRRRIGRKTRDDEI